MNSGNSNLCMINFRQLYPHAPSDDTERSNTLKNTHILIPALYL